MELNNFIQIVDNLDSSIDSYTNELSHTVKTRVIEVDTGRKGVIISKNVDDPEGNSKGKGFIVQWMITGGQSWFPKNELEKVNGKIKEVNPEMLDYLLTLRV